MNQQATVGIVLIRTNYGEADRILTLLTPGHGKLRLMARGVRRVKSKLAGGIELFSISQITFIKGRGEIGTLVSARLAKHYGRIVKDIGRTQLGYELIRILNRVTEDEPGLEYFDLLEQTFQALDEPRISERLVDVWFGAQLLRLGGHGPNLQTDTSGSKLERDVLYSFDFDSMSFARNHDGAFTADHIKFLRILFSGNTPSILRRVQGSGGFARDCAPLVRTMLENFLRI